MSELISDKQYFHIFNNARAGSDRPVGILRGIRAVIAAYERTAPSAEQCPHDWKLLSNPHWRCLKCGAWKDHAEQQQQEPVALEQLIDSMCMTWRHDFFLVVDEDAEPPIPTSGMTEIQREGLRAQMRQLLDRHGEAIAGLYTHQQPQAQNYISDNIRQTIYAAIENMRAATGDYDEDGMERHVEAKFRIASTLEQWLKTIPWEADQPQAQGEPFAWFYDNEHHCALHGHCFVLQKNRPDERLSWVPVFREQPRAAVPDVRATYSMLQAGAQVLWEKQFENSPWKGKVKLIDPSSMDEYREVAQNVFDAMLAAAPPQPADAQGGGSRE